MFLLLPMVFKANVISFRFGWTTYSLFGFFLLFTSCTFIFASVEFLSLKNPTETVFLVFLDFSWIWELLPKNWFWKILYKMLLCGISHNFQISFTAGWKKLLIKFDVLLAYTIRKLQNFVVIVKKISFNFSAFSNKGLSGK